MLLKKLIKSCPKNAQKIDISGLALDSRDIKKGNLFFALRGKKYNGEKFVNDALIKGAKVIIVSKNSKIKNKYIPIIKVSNIKDILTYACIKFFKHKPKNIILVTGTNGKSSVAEFFYQILTLNKTSVASIGTLGIKTNKTNKKTNLTSPNIISLHSELEKIKKSNIDNVIIEASSHGLHQGRLDGLDIKAGIFTNFSQDHLDYHKSMNSYFKAKMILFKRLVRKKGFIILNSEIKEFNKIKKIGSSRKLKIIDIKNKKIFNEKNIVNLKGDFQKKNLLMSILAANLCGVSSKKTSLITKDIKAVNGRLELVRTLLNKAKIFIDFAHTPHALYTALKSLNREYKSNITLIFGCGGERDKKKRPLMAKIAKQFCKKIYITDDNPRNENPKKIRKELINVLKKDNYFDIGNRSLAIKTAIKKSQPFEIILIAGKGHETQQDYGNKIINISDKKIVKKTKFIFNSLSQKEYGLKYNSNILANILKSKKNYNFYGATINSKEVKKENLFIAIKGKNHDGHDFVQSAIKKGASVCVVSKNIKQISKKKLIKTKNTNNFLNILAHKKRIFSKAKVIAVTGSAGKTTVKTLLGNLLNQYSKTFFSPKSYNNHYGVPISLCNLEQNHRFAVLEVGMSKKGEINKLSKLINPHVGIITNVAEAHIKNFKNLKGIAKAKIEILNNIKKGGSIILNRDDKFFNYFSNLSKNKNINVISFGFSKKSNVYLISTKKLENSKILKIKVIDEVIELKINNINILNVLCLLAVLKIMNLDLKHSIKYFSSLRPLEGRGKKHIIKRYKTRFNLIDESYNANPLSVSKAINNMSKIKKKNFNKYLLLGDMLELGEKSSKYHKKLSKVINKADIDKVFIYGDKILNAYRYIKKNKQGNILQFIDDFDQVFSKIIKKNDFLMIKGSNGTGLNKLSQSLIKGSVNVI